MPKNAKKWIMNLVKVAIAVVGLWYVISTTPWNDRATIDHTRLKNVKGDVANLWGAVLLEDVRVTVLDPDERMPVNRDLIHIRFPATPVAVARDNKTGKEILGQPQPDGTVQREVDIPRKYLQIIESPDQRLEVPHIEIGVKNLIKLAKLKLWLLLLALVSLGIPFMVTAWRWMKLMEPQGISLPYSKCLALTFVGQFYSTFLPGSVSGDVIKIYYTSKVTGSRTKSTVTVLLDRIIGLIALMLIAGIAAAFQLSDPKMRTVVIAVAIIFVALAIGATIYFSHRLRNTFGLTRLLENPKIPDFVRRSDEVLHAYHGHRATLFLAFFAALFAQLAIPVSAWIAGTALGIEKANLGHYLAYVPIASLAAALPISFLGLGVMDPVLFRLFFGLADASQTFALAQCIRFLPVIWNMLGAYWVVTGTYSRHQALEDDKKEGHIAGVGILDSSLDPGV
jgi:uncharacterized protein (TIRG00374 family)